MIAECGLAHFSWVKSGGFRKLWKGKAKLSVIEAFVHEIRDEPVVELDNAGRIVLSRDFMFLHGGMQGGWVWNQTIAAMRQQQQHDEIGRLLACDVPGCGMKAAQDTGDLQVQDIVTSLIADVLESGIRDAVLVGHSQAGTIIPHLISQRPDLFSHAVYVSCIAPIGSQTALTWRDDMFEEETSALRHDPATPPRDRYRAMFCNDMQDEEANAFLDHLGSDSWPASSYAMSGWDYDHLQHCPSTYVVCLRDATLLPAWQDIFAQRLHARNVFRIDAGHQVMNTRPHALAEILRTLV